MAKKTTIQSDDDKATQDARRWKNELQLAHKREKTWREDCDKIVRRYRTEERVKNRFNILWSNTEILRPAIYNTKPAPDVRRRFRDSDPIGKAVSEVLERSLVVFTDGIGMDESIKNDVLDSLLCGRGVSRIRYMPTIKQLPIDQDDSDDEEGGDSEPNEELEYEQVILEHVDWHDFRHGYGRTWDEVDWAGFRHKLSRSDAQDKFGKEPLTKITFSAPTTDEDVKTTEIVGDTEKVADFWEIWDKAKKRVFFLQDNCDYLLFPIANPDGAAPIDFPGFFPNAEPLRIIENTGSLIPLTHFGQYQNQADQLDIISARIDKIIASLKLRGIYDAKLKELGGLMSSDDNELVPVENAQAWINSGLDKAVMWMPVEQAVAVLTALYDARDRQKAIIDELTGISDIVRGVTDANETYGAQQLKSGYASVRLQRMQKEVQRYARDCMRLAAAVMCEKFGADTFAQMTDLKFPTAQEKQQLQMRAQLAQQPPMPGMPPPQPVDPALLQMPSWDDILQLMKSNSIRQYRIDIETDSTIAGTLESDMGALTQVLTGVGDVLERMAPAVQSGSLPIDAAKELIMAVIRRAKLGSAVEDAFEKMQAPQPPPPPPPDPHIQVAQIKAQSDQQIAQLNNQADQQKTAATAQADELHQHLEAQRNQLAEQLKHERELATTASQVQADHINAQLTAQKELILQQQKANDSLMEAKLNAAVKIIVAQITAKAATDAAAEAEAGSEVERDLA